jgi:hypothetical protein
MHWKGRGLEKGSGGVVVQSARVPSHAPLFQEKPTGKLMAMGFLTGSCHCRYCLLLLDRTRVSGQLRNGWSCHGLYILRMCVLRKRPGVGFHLHSWALASRLFVDPTDCTVLAKQPYHVYRKCILRLAVETRGLRNESLLFY